METIENFLNGFGLMTGEGAAAKRFLLGAGVGGGLVFAAKPTLMFDENGDPRPWAATSEDDNATAIPWWMGVMFPGVLLGVFI